MDFKSAIHPAALDLVLNSATNASQKGQSQYSTPKELAIALSADLTSHRPVIIDLTSGPGQLLAGAINLSTGDILGCDVDPRRNPAGAGPRFRFIHADVTTLYEPMRQLEFQADCFVLNPPWSMNWHADRLEGLANSEVPAVAKTFKALFPLQPGRDRHAQAGDTIDSTLATLMIALDRLSRNGEGLLIGYSSTIERLIFAPGAPGEMLVQHIWKRKAIADIKTEELPIDLPEPLKLSSVIYFSASHEDGPTADGKAPRFMPRVRPYLHRSDTVSLWEALTERAAEMRPNARPRYHLSLSNNQLMVNLGLFDTHLTKINHELAERAKRLQALDGRNPMQVVMQRDERNFILGLLKPGAEWTVDPALKEAVQNAVNEYNAVRAPLVALPKIQRLGYLDESDEIKCVKDLWLFTQELEDGSKMARCTPIFEAGKTYQITTRSMQFTRTQFKPNLRGEEEELELSGQELAIYITSQEQWCFMDGSLRASNVKIGEDSGLKAVDFTLQELVDHFDIPEVPHLASIDPIRFQFFVSQLRQLEQLTDA